MARPQAEEPFAKSASHAQPKDATEDEEDDYMTMAIPDPSSSTTNSARGKAGNNHKPHKQHETSLQRLQRQKRESEARAYTPPKAERARLDALAQQTALTTSILPPAPLASSTNQHVTPDRSDSATSKGASMMAKLGYKPGQRLGAEGNVNALAEPIGFEMKEGREGVGMEGEKKRKFREEVERQAQGEKKMKVESEDYRSRVGREREEKRAEGMWWGGMKILEEFEEAKADGNEEREQEKDAGLRDNSDDGFKEDRDVAGEVVPRRKKPSRQRYKIAPLLIRPLVNQRKEKEQERRARYDLLQSLSRDATYTHADEDADDRLALGREEEDGDDEANGKPDAELEEYLGLDSAERLGKVVQELRKCYLYCFWCKSRYEDEGMEGCPGPDEEDHE